MSIMLSGIGHRILEVRKELGFIQSKMAVILEIADKTYKNYEQEKREIPLSVAVNFCEKFNVDLHWLIYGEEKAQQLQIDYLSSLIRAFFEHGQLETKTSEEIEKYARYICTQLLAKKTEPVDEAREFFLMLNGE